MWYVMQVRTGNEFYMKQQCERMISPEAAEKVTVYEEPPQEPNAQ